LEAGAAESPGYMSGHGAAQQPMPQPAMVHTEPRNGQPGPPPAGSNPFPPPEVAQHAQHTAPGGFHTADNPSRDRR
jgi:hypothetical protein